MSSFQVPILQIRDDSWGIGLRLGEQLRHQRIIKMLEGCTKPAIDESAMKSVYKEFAPHLLEELQGLAEGLEMTEGRAAALLSGYDMPMLDVMGCSTAVTTRAYTRNYDFSPSLYDGYFSLLESRQSQATAGYNLQAIGRHDGVNASGLAAGLHFVSYEGYRTGLSAWMSVRMVLEGCSSVDEAVLMLKAIPHAACYNFSLGDSGGRMAAVEASPGGGVRVRYEEELLSCVNHFESSQLTGFNRSRIGGSLRRAEFIREQLQSQSPDEMFQRFSDPASPLFFTDYEGYFGTLHSFSYSFADTVILTSIAKGEPLRFSFQDWMNGAELRQDKLLGSIE